VDETGSGSCPMASFEVNSVESLGYAIKESIIYG
jgi:hypothetical protein